MMSEPLIEERLNDLYEYYHGNRLIRKISGSKYITAIINLV
jgi:hypothetical protein